jgi:succinate dehydrogenase hydrophobic anchor subunit
MQAYIELFLGMASSALALVFLLLVVSAIYFGKIGVNGSKNPTFTWATTPGKFLITLAVYLVIAGYFAFFAFEILRKFSS